MDNIYILSEELSKKLNNDENDYIKNAPYLIKWLNILIYDKDFDYMRWANENDIIIMQKLLG